MFLMRTDDVAECQLSICRVDVFRVLILFVFSPLHFMHSKRRVQIPFCRYEKNIRRAYEIKRPGTCDLRMMLVSKEAHTGRAKVKGPDLHPKKNSVCATG